MTVRRLSLQQKFTAKSRLYSADPMEIQLLGGFRKVQAITVLGDVQTESCLPLEKKVREKSEPDKHREPRQSDREEERLF